MRIGFLIIMMGMFGCAIMLLFIYNYEHINHEIEKVDCYDHLNNKMIGIKCENDKIPLVIPLGISLSMITMLFGIIISITED